MTLILLLLEFQILKFPCRAAIDRFNLQTYGSYAVKYDQVRILYNMAKRTGLKQSKFIIRFWAGIRQAIPPNLNCLDFNEDELNWLEFRCGEKRFLFH